MTCWLWCLFVQHCEDMLCWCCGLWLLGFGGGQIKFFSGGPVKLGLSLVWKNRLRHTVADICTCHWKVCVHSYSNSLFFFLTFALSLTHAIKQSASHQSPGSLPSPPPSSLSPPLSLSCKHYPSNGSLEDTKTSSYLTPDTNLRALTVVYLGIKHTHKATWAPRKKNRQSRHAINPPPSHTLHPSSPQTLSSSEEPYSLTYLCTSTTNRYRSVCMCVCVCLCVCLCSCPHLQMRSQIVPVCVFVHAWAVQRQLKANSGILSGSKWDAAGRQWQQPRCVFRLFMWNHLKANKRSLPPLPRPSLPLCISQYKGKKWMNERAAEEGGWGKGLGMQGWGRVGEWSEVGAGEWAKQGWRYFFPPVLWDNSGPGDVVSHGTPLQAGRSTSPQGGSLCWCAFLWNTFRMIFDSEFVLEGL